MERLKGLPPAIPRAYYARLPSSPSSEERASRPWYGAIPGFRSGRRWRYPVAVLGYGVFGLWVAQLPFHPLVGALGAGALLVFLFATDAFGLRRWAPLFGSPVVAGAGWVLLTVLVLAAAFVAGGPMLPSSSAASQLPLPSVSSTTMTPDPTASPSPSTSPAGGPSVLHTPTPTPTSRPIQVTPTPTGGSTPRPTPPPTPPPTPVPTPTPTPRPTPTPTPTPTPGH